MSDTCASIGCRWKERGDELYFVTFRAAEEYPIDAAFVFVLCDLHVSALVASPIAAVNARPVWRGAPGDSPQPARVFPPGFFDGTGV